jgi:hypothetical protein
MTNEELIVWRAACEKARTLLSRLDSGDELHREAADRLRQLRKELNEEIQGAQRDAADAYQEGRWQEREESGQF